MINSPGELIDNHQNENGDRSVIIDGEGGERMDKRDKKLSADLQVGAECHSVRTTLYELIAAINEDVQPEEDWVVTDVVLEWFESGRAKFLAATMNNAL